MNLKKDFIICSNQSFGAVYNIPTCKLISVSPEFAENLKDEIKKENISENSIAFFEENFKYNSYNNDSIDFLINKKLCKLQFLVTNRCNLNCKYCYANGGTYNQECSDMLPDTAENIIENLSKYVNEIDSIQFFGGEPLLVYKTIMRICDKISNTFKSMPKFYVVSNFTVLPLEFIKYIKKYNIFITVSLDGPAEINNILRISKSVNKFNTFNTVKNNINILRSYNLDINAIECTYTDTHKKLGYTKSALINFYKDEFNITNVIIADEEKSDSFSSINSIKQEYNFNNYSNISLDTKVSVIKSIFNSKYKKFHCGVGFNAISIMPNGDIYPCHRFFSNKKYCMGNIFNKQLTSCEEFNNMRKLLFSISKENEKCVNCQARNFCCQCPAYVLLNNGNNFNKNVCMECKNISEDLVLNFLKFYKSDKYFDFMSQIRNIAKEKNIYGNPNG